MDRNEEELGPAETDFDVAMDLFMLYVIQYDAWKKPQGGAVSPARSAFFEASPPGESGLVGFARWLMMGHESNDGIDLLNPELALALVDALELSDADEVSKMRQTIVHAAALRDGHLEED
jgi:hypothetical protein